MTEQAERATGFWNFIRNLSFIGLLSLVVYGFYLSFSTTEVLRVYNEPMPLIDNTIRPGEPIVLVFDYEKLVSVKAEVIPRIVCQGTTDQENYFLPSYNSSVQAEGRKTENFTVGVVPLHARTSESCYVELSIEYKTNALHTEELVLESDKFAIVDGAVIYLPL